MIILSNYDRFKEESLAEKMKRKAAENNSIKMYQLKDRFKKEVERASNNGLTSIEFVLADKDNFNFLNESLIKDFYNFILDNGFDVSYNHVSIDGKPPFYLFNVKWG